MSRKFLRKLTPHPFEKLLEQFQLLSATVGELKHEIALLTLEIQDMAKKSASVADALAQLQADVTAETTVEQSVVVLLNGIPAQIAAAVAAATAAGATPDQLAAFDTLASTIETNTAALSTAVTANTPTAPAPTGGTDTGTDTGTDVGTAPADGGSTA